MYNYQLPLLDVNRIPIVCLKEIEYYVNNTLTVIK